MVRGTDLRFFLTDSFVPNKNASNELNFIKIDAITMDSRKKWRFTLEQLKSLRLKREKWQRDQERLIKYEKLRLRKINEYEERRKQAALMKNSDKQESLQQSKSNNPQRRGTSSPNYEHSKEWKTSVIFNPENITNMKNLKITIKADNCLSTNYQTSNNIECDIKDPNNIILPRRQDEGACPIFKRIEIEKSEEIRKITFSQDEQLEKELSTSRKNTSTSRSLNDDIIHHYCYSSSKLCYKSTMCRKDRIDDNKRYRDRRLHNSTRESKEKDRDRNERRNRSSLHYSNHSASFTRDRSRSHYRSRSRSLTSERDRERKKDNNEIRKFSSKRNYSDQSCNLDNRASSKLHSSSDSFYNSYIRLPRPMLMPIPRVPPMLMPVFPGSVLPMPFPPNIYHQQPHLRFVNGRGIGIYNNRYNAQHF
ncbi:PREDICTED: RNA-binding protein 25-like isoform X2 [Acromyrmex echinatior]|uniref:RNA-binding protein 25-like isoform X2 n=1 Tax=Acromyrmex echinatior TaxID=103372 RepID=UPI000580E2DE|nr:PREDICTED: RNA-binding protein 25-like isoform X2 [Acromyrmex echinatior]